jgi:putative hydrolase of the HAD superfamily
MSALINTLVFDLDDTLVVEEASAKAAIIETAELARARYGLDPHEMHKTLRKTCRELWYQFPSHPYCKRVGISSWEGLWAEFTGSDTNLRALRGWASTYRFESWRTSLSRHGIDDPDLAAELTETFPQIRRCKHTVYPDAIKALERFSRSYSLGLLTNGAPDLQRRKMNGAGITGYFDQILISGDVGIGKPDVRIFEMILTRLKANPKTSLMIGNSLTSDVQGARSIGMQAVWINRPGKSRDDSIIPDWEITSLDELDSIACRMPACPK